MCVARDFLTECLSQIYRPRETRPIEEWARETITIEAGENRMMAGTPFEIENAPYNRIIFDFLQCPYSRELVVVKSSQIGFTFTVYVGIAWYLQHTPGNCMYVARDLLAVRELGKQRLTPILKQIGGDITDELEDRNQTCVTKSINGATLRLVGAQSAQGFVSWPCSLGAVDEAETHPDLPEGTTTALTRARFKGDDEYKLIVFSKPQDQPQYSIDKGTKQSKLISGQGTRLMDEYYSGTQEKYHIPCPYCGHFQELLWSNMKLDPGAIVSAPGVLPIEYDREKVKELTYYECQSADCRKRIVDRDKRRIVPLGKWVAADPDKREGPYKTPYPGRRSVQISDLYVFLFQTVHWGTLMLKWLEAQGDDQKLDAFYNDHLGLPRPVRKSAGTVDVSMAQKLIGDYKRIQLYTHGRAWANNIPDLEIDPIFIGISVDKQKEFFKYTIQAYTKGGEMWVLDYGYLATEDDLTFLLANFLVRSKSGLEYRLYAALIDSGYLGPRVIEYCYSIQGIIPYVSPARGVGTKHCHGGMWIRKDTTIPGREVHVLCFDSQAWEDELYRHRIIDANPNKPHWRHPAIHLPKDVDDDFLLEITNAMQVEEIRHGAPTGNWIWEKARKNDSNDFADTLKMGLLIWAANEPEEEQENQDLRD